MTSSYLTVQGLSIASRCSPPAILNQERSPISRRSSDEHAEPTARGAHCNRGRLIESPEDSNTFFDLWDFCLHDAPVEGSVSYNQASDAVSARLDTYFLTAHTIYIMIWLDIVKRILVLNVKVLSWSLAVVVAAQVGTWASGETTGFFAKGTALRVEGKPQEALEAFQQALVAAPGQAEILVQMGATLEDLGKLQAAADCYRRALRRAPDHAAARRNLEQLEALRALNDLPKSPHPAKEELLQRGVQAMEEHDLDRALALFRLSRGILDQDPRPLFFSAIAAERRGLTRNAIGLYEETVTVFPGFAPGWTNLVIALLLSGDPQDAVTRVQEARKAVPDDRGIRWLFDFTVGRAR